MKIFRRVGEVAKRVVLKARSGEIKNFTVIDSPYEAPEQPEIALNGEQLVTKFGG